MENTADIKVLLGRHDERITRNEGDIASNSQEVQSVEKEIGDFLIDDAKVKATQAARLIQIQWILGLMVAGLFTLAFAVFRGGLVP